MTIHTVSESELSRHGFAVIPDVLSCQEVDAIKLRLDGDSGNNAGSRKLLDLEWCRQLAQKLRRDSALHVFLPEGMQPVQCTLFSKTAENNWLVGLHQDLSIPVAERVKSERCTGWCEKEGVTFVQPPIEILENLVAIRLHIDDCNEQNGALRVVPGSHRLGRLCADAALRERESRGECCVPVAQGGAMVMRPLLLHASSKSAAPQPRRVLHFLFGPALLTERLQWPTRSPSSASGFLRAKGAEVESL